MTKKRFTLFAIVMAAFVLFVGCKKEKTEETSTAKNEASVDMLQFQTSEDLFNYLENVEANNERNGFVSFGKMADDAYYSINPEEMFSNMDEVIDYVLEHRDLFQLILGSDGEYTVETRMYNHPFRHLANQDGIFQVGDTLYRIIEDGYAYTSLENEECLKDYVDNGSRESTSVIKYYTFSEESDIKGNHPHHCEDYQLENDNTIGNNRIHLEIRNHKDGPINTNYYKHGYSYYAKPYHKSLGWWGCNRTITANVYKVMLGRGGVFVFTEDAPTVTDSVHGGSSFYFTKHVGSYEYEDTYSIYSCLCTASTLDAGTVIVDCNS